MKYVAFTQPGGPDVLHVAEVPTPIAQRGEILIEVEAAGVARADVMQRAGQYPPPPGSSPILGLEVSGVVSALGEGVDGFTAGDRVCALSNGGGYAEYVAVPLGQVLPIPDEWSFIEAASLPENAFTVYDNVFTRARLSKDETLLVHGGTSGIGSMAIMLARAFGAHAIATAGSAKKVAACMEFGAEYAMNYHEVDFVDEIRRYTDSRGVDVVLDIVGGSYIERDIQCLAHDGRITCIAMVDAPLAKIDLRQMIARRASVMASSLRPRTDAQKAAIAQALRERVWPLLPARDLIFPVIDSVFTFSDASQAHRRLESSEHIGKIILVPDPR